MRGTSPPQECVPQAEQAGLLDHLHAKNGHVGRDGLIALIYRRYYFPRVTQAVAEAINRCDVCVQFGPRLLRALITTVVMMEVMQLHSMDYMTLRVGVGNMKTVLLITDYFSHFTRRRISLAKELLDTRRTS